MSVSPVITMGLGSWGTPSLLITLGYGIGADVLERDYTVDECTVFSTVRGDLFSAVDRGDLLTSPNRGDLFTRECE